MAGRRRGYSEIRKGEITFLICDEPAQPRGRQPECARRPEAGAVSVWRVNPEPWRVQRQPAVLLMEGKGLAF